ncbi:hypothetical protein Tco_1112577 [Tanacetum coccineum]|uniref:CCHC-type domain-containing protein n=1 Tax=Tanacetum coccineum TaxID=301880 RepID=A0ABQ5IQ06_9ASTR
MTTDLTEKKVSSGSLPVCERFFTRHDGPCMTKYHKCGKVGHKARYCKEKSVATGANAQPILTCYDCGEPGPNVVTGTFLLNNRYASVLFDLGSDRSFVNTRFSSMLDIELVKISASYEVELADGRVVSMNTVLKGCTLNLVNHLFEIDLMLIELDVPVIRDFPEVFPDDLSELPPPRVVGTTARGDGRKDYLSEFAPWVHRCVSVKRKMESFRICIVYRELRTRLTVKNRYPSEN